MASAVLLTYERKNAHSRNLAVKRAQGTSNGHLLDRGLTDHDEPIAESGARGLRFPAAYAPPYMQSDTASEDSFGLKRKSMSLNGGAFTKTSNFDSGKFGKNLGKRDRQQLRKKLKMDLQHVLALSEKVQAREMQVLARAQTSLNDSHSTGFGSKDNGPLNRHNKDSIKDGRIVCHSTVATLDETSPGIPSINQKVGVPSKGGDLSDKKTVGLLKQCDGILKKLMTHRFGWVFNKPVDAVKLHLHDYHTIIKRPMDLGTIKKKLSAKAYLLPMEFAEDVRLTFTNAMLYNPPGQDVHMMAMSLKSIFEEKWRTLEEKLINLERRHERRTMDLYKEVTQHSSQVLAQKTVQPLPPSKLAGAQKAKTPCQGKSSAKSKVKCLPLRKMTFEEKRTLSDNLGNLPPDKLELALQIIRSKSTNLEQTEDGIEVDMDSFDLDTLWKLHRLVLDSLQDSYKSKELVHRTPQTEKLLPSASQLIHGAPNLPTVSQKVEGVDEDVDIVDELPHPEFPPIKMDKERGCEKANSSSSSSSSGSGSSSSDSDSGSSSGSETDAADVQSAAPGSKLTQPEKEPKDFGDIAIQRGRPSPDADGGKRSLSGLDEENVPANVSPLDVNSQDGEAKEVSDERKRRAALLRSRFAETILKAHEKNFSLDKSDPEKLKKGWEEMEQRKREERVRLQAEAKAAEIAWNRAEAQAAAEAKRRRDAEREAARLALQNMEKTVMIENSEILRDLEMLGTAPENILSSVDETSPMLSPDCMPSFAPQAGYPLLEQLGLFMKNDEEEEERDSSKSDEGQGEIED